MLCLAACRLLALLGVIGLAAATQAATVDFGTDFQSLPYSEEGLTFSDVTGMSPATIGGFGAEKALVAGTNDTPVRVRATGSQPFDLLSLDIEFFTRTWRIESSSGAILNVAATGTIDFATIPGWSNLTYFDVIHDPAEPNGSVQIDNVTFTFVPEPSTSMLAAGLILGMVAARRG